MIEDILRAKKCFKLVCGAGNEDPIEVEKLVALYARAGAQYFDLSANPEVVIAAKNGISRVIPKDEISNYYLNVSVGIAGDPHVSKALINNTLCKSCGLCLKLCMQNAIYNTDSYVVNDKKCIGCMKCVNNCPYKAIQTYSIQKDFNQILPPLISMGLSSLELHAISDDNDKIYSQWNELSCIFDGIISVCTDRSHSSDALLVERLKYMTNNRKPYTTIVQADGAPMSGGSDNYESTLQAVATAQIVQRAKIPAFTMLSGGTNSKTTELAKMCGIEAHGIAIGSFARKIVREYIDRDDFLSNTIVFDKAVHIATNLVNTCLSQMR